MRAVGSRAASRRSVLAGLWHVRGGPPASFALAVAALVVTLFPALYFTVQYVFANPGRGVNVREAVPVGLASILPALTVPSFDRRERHATARARLGLFAYSTLVLFAPLLILPIWRTTVRVRFPDQDLPPVTGLVGNVMLFCCVGTVLTLVLGRVASVGLTPILFAAFVSLQQARPGSFWTTRFAYNLDWHTDWAITSAVTAATLAFIWARRSLPRVDGG